MNKANNKILAVPTNIITGFLGAGKTTAIKQLLTEKPADERWAILVNEFGEIGVDGSLYNNDVSASSNIFIQEVAGGCMCCASVVPMQIALNTLLKQARPHRLLIEPTGLGHPKEVLQILQSEHYRDVIDLQKTITLVDARQLSDHRYTDHQTFNEQIAIADTVIGSKEDLYIADEKQKLERYVTALNHNVERIDFTQFGQLNMKWLQGKTVHKLATKNLPPVDPKKSVVNDEPVTGTIKAENKGEGFVSKGWRFSADQVFDYQKLINFLNIQNPIRAKGVFITTKGCFSYNKSTDSTCITSLNSAKESRLEVIDRYIDDTLESGLISTISV